MVITRWKGPDVLVVGWIPFRLQVPVNSGIPANLASTLLLQSGNPQPPQTFAGYPGFANWLYPLNLNGTKEYRAAFYLQGVEAEFSDDGTLPRISHNGYGYFPGFTPYRIFVGSVNIAPLFPIVPRYSKGRGPSSMPMASFDSLGAWAEYRFRVEFKLSNFANGIQRQVTGYWAPYAWCELSYRIAASGQTLIRVFGSAIPSQRLYLDWASPRRDLPAGIEPDHDMLSASANQYDGFLQSPSWGCRPAPLVSQLCWQGSAIRA